jgi:ABC-type nickel/cobalt efflux system permease component RcnA
LFGLDNQIAGLSDGHAVLVVVVVAVLLGLRHATDPDHLAAVSTLIASERRDGARSAGRLGLAWGGGHATSLFLFGLPIVFSARYLPDAVQRAAEAAVGVMIMLLALRLLVRWRRGQFHTHPHRHDGIEHRHLHPHRHDQADHSHDHDHRPVLGRSPLQAYGIGLVHGMGGSAGVGLLLLAGIANRGLALAALVLFACCTALSMALLSVGFGLALSRGPIVRRVIALAPAMGSASLVFGAWYLLGALDVVPYAL